MHRMARSAILLPFIAVVTGSILLAQNATMPTPPLKLERVIPLPGVEGRIDHLAFDSGRNRVFIAALGNGTVEVVDLARGERTVEITGLKEPQGLLYLPQNNTLYVASGGDGTVRSYNGKTLATIGSITVGDDADNLRWDSRTNSVIVGYGDGAIAFLPLDLKGKPISEVALPAHPESFQVTLNGSHVFVNLPHDQSIASFEIGSTKLETKWTHLGAQSNFPMTIDRSHGRFFVACRAPAQLLALREDALSVGSRISSVGDADDLFWDESHSQVFVIGGEGFVDVVNAPPNGEMKSIAHIPTSAGARTGLLAGDKLLVAAPHRGTETARLLVFHVE
jgi:DNA-binding beta-propeller fold protein YncE